MNDPIITIKNLKTHFHTDEGILKAVENVSLSVGERESLGIIGESGCGKTVTAQSILQIVPAPGRIMGGEVWLRRKGRPPIDLVTLRPYSPEMRSIKWKEISMIFQEPMTSFSPIHTIGRQIEEAIRVHVTSNQREAHHLAVEMLGRVGIPKPEERIDAYPYQLSGGLRQRAMIAMALSCQPTLLIADEPTTALDVTVQAQILELIKELQAQFNMAVLYITHDLGVIAEVTARVSVMYLGRIVESGTTEEVFKRPLHPYTRKLLESIPKLGRKARVRLNAIQGTVPIPLGLPVQCGFVDRCTEKFDRCMRSIPALVNIGGSHSARCFLHSQASEEDQNNG